MSSQKTRFFSIFRLVDLEIFISSKNIELVEMDVFHCKKTYIWEFATDPTFSVFVHCPSILSYIKENEYA